MGLAALPQAAERIQQLGEMLSETEKELIMQFTFRTGDMELTERFIEELIQPFAEKEAICKKFQALEDRKSDWIQTIENLVVSLERYRMQEEKVEKEIEELLSIYGVVLSEKEIRELSLKEWQEFTEKEKKVQIEEMETKIEKEEKETEDTYGRGNTRSNSDCACRL